MGMGVWFLLAHSAGRLAARVSGRRGLFWLIAPIVFFLPLADVFTGAVVAQIWLYKLPPVRPAAPIRTDGYRIMGHTTVLPVLDNVAPTGPFQYLEVEYPERPSWSHADPGLGCGFYQFRTPRYSSSCPDVPGAGSDSHYRYDGRCFYVTHSKSGLARYAYGSTSEPPIFSRPWNNVRMNCIRVVDLVLNDDVARECGASVDSWLFVDQAILIMPFRRNYWSSTAIFVAEE